MSFVIVDCKGDNWLLKANKAGSIYPYSLYKGAAMEFHATFWDSDEAKRYIERETGGKIQGIDNGGDK